MALGVEKSRRGFIRGLNDNVDEDSPHDNILERRNNETVDKEKSETLGKLLKSFGCFREPESMDSLIPRLKDSNVHVDAIREVFRRFAGGTSCTTLPDLKYFVSCYGESRYQVLNELNDLLAFQRRLKVNAGKATRGMKKHDPARAGVVINIDSLNNANGLDAFGDYVIRVGLFGKNYSTQRVKPLNGCLSFAKQNGTWQDEAGLFRISPFERGAPGRTQDCYKTGIYTTENFIIELLKYPISGSYEVVEKCFLPLNDFAHQKMDKMKIQLGDSVLSVAIQWKHDTAILFAAQLEKAAEEMKLMDISISTHKTLLAAFEKPFKSTVTKDLLSGKLMGDGLNSLLDVVGLSKAQKVSQVILSFHLSLTCLMSFARPVYLDQGVGVICFFLNLEARRWTPKKYQTMITCLGIATILDIWWSSLYLFRWGGEAVDLQFVWLTRILSGANFFWRFVLIAIFWQNHNEVKKRPISGSVIHKYKAV